MENASKALMVVTEVLIGILLLSLLVFLFVYMGSWSRNIESNMDARELYEFNTKFSIYDGRKDLTAQDVVSIINLAKNYNEKYDAYKVEVEKPDGNSFPVSINKDLLSIIDLNEFFKGCSGKEVVNTEGKREYKKFLYSCSIEAFNAQNSYVSRIIVKYEGIES